MVRPAICAVILYAAVAGGQAPAQVEATGTRHVYFTVIDRKGDPITDLTADEVTIREDGSTRAIVGIEKATAPLEVALLVDDSGPGLRFIREGAGVFIQRLAGLGQFSLTSTGGKNTRLLDFTSQTETLYNGVRQLTTRNTSNAVDGSYLLDAVHDAIDALNERSAERPVIVILTLETGEFSSRRADRLLDELQRSRALLYVVSLGKPTLKTMSSWNEGPMQSLRENLDENMNRKKFLEDGVRLSGGAFEQVLVDSGLPAAMTSIAGQLASQYVAVYTRGHTESPKKIAVAVKRSGAKVRVRTDLPRSVSK